MEGKSLLKLANFIKDKKKFDIAAYFISYFEDLNSDKEEDSRVTKSDISVLCEAMEKRASLLGGRVSLPILFKVDSLFRGGNVDRDALLKDSGLTELFTVYTKIFAVQLRHLENKRLRNLEKRKKRAAEQRRTQCKKELRRKKLEQSLAKADAVLNKSFAFSMSDKMMEQFLNRIKTRAPIKSDLNVDLDTNYQFDKGRYHFEILTYGGVCCRFDSNIPEAPHIGTLPPNVNLPKTLKSGVKPITIRRASLVSANGLADEEEISNALNPLQWVLGVDARARFAYPHARIDRQSLKENALVVWQRSSGENGSRRRGEIFFPVALCDKKNEVSGGVYLQIKTSDDLDMTRDPVSTKVIWPTTCMFGGSYQAVLDTGQCNTMIDPARAIPAGTKVVDIEFDESWHTDEILMQQMFHDLTPLMRSMHKSDGKMPEIHPLIPRDGYFLYAIRPYILGQMPSKKLNKTLDAIRARSNQHMRFWRNFSTENDCVVRFNGTGLTPFFDALFKNAKKSDAEKTAETDKTFSECVDEFLKELELHQELQICQEKNMEHMESQRRDGVKICHSESLINFEDKLFRVILNYIMNHVDYSGYPKVPRAWDQVKAYMDRKTENKIKTERIKKPDFDLKFSVSQLGYMSYITSLLICSSGRGPNEVAFLTAIQEKHLLLAYEECRKFDEELPPVTQVLFTTPLSCEVVHAGHWIYYVEHAYKQIDLLMKTGVMKDINRVIGSFAIANSGPVREALYKRISETISVLENHLDKLERVQNQSTCAMLDIKLPALKECLLGLVEAEYARRVLSVDTKMVSRAIGNLSYENQGIQGVFTAMDGIHRLMFFLGKEKRRLFHIASAGALINILQFFPGIFVLLGDSRNRSCIVVLSTVAGLNTIDTDSQKLLAAVGAISTCMPLMCAKKSFSRLYALRTISFFTRGDADNKTRTTTVGRGPLPEGCQPQEEIIGVGTFLILQ